MRIATIVYILLVALVAVNITQVIDLGWLLALPPVILAGAIIAYVHYRVDSIQTLYLTLSVIGFVSLAAVSLTALLPALAVLDNGSGAEWTSSLIPMFVAAVGLYGAGLWIRWASAEQNDALDWIANFLSGPGLFLSLLTALVLSTGTLLALDWVEQNWSASLAITRRFLDRGIIPPVTVLFFYWGMLILLGKWWNAQYLKSRLHRWQSNSDHKVTSHADRIRSLSSDGERLDDRLEFLWRRHDESFTVPRYLAGAVPVLGFIGTVLGISLAADGISQLIASDSGLSGLSSELGIAIAPLGIAFDTTLIALSLGVLLLLCLTLVQRSEERVLNNLERHLRDNVRVY